MNFVIELITPTSVVRNFIYNAWEEALGDLEKWMKRDLIKALVFGGLGIEGIAQTGFYKFITSPEGLSELGIEKDQPPRLLRAYERDAFKVKKSKRVITLQFGNVAKLKSATPHPASGTGQLKVSSWLDWIIDGEQVMNRGFVPRRKIGEEGQKYIRLGTPLGGLMLPRGAYRTSLGSWRFPPAYAHYEDDWLIKNGARIQRAIIDQMVVYFQMRLNS